MPKYQKSHDDLETAPAFSYTNGRPYEPALRPANQSNLSLPKEAPASERSQVINRLIDRLKTV